MQTIIEYRSRVGFYLPVQEPYDPKTVDFKQLSHPIEQILNDHNYSFKCIERNLRVDENTVYLVFEISSELQTKDLNITLNDLIKLDNSRLTGLLEEYDHTLYWTRMTTDGTVSPEVIR